MEQPPLRMNRNQEGTFVRAFIVPAKHDRYFQFLADPKRRAKILSRLYHALDIVADRTTMLAGRDHFPEPLTAILQQKGAGQSCYLISPDNDLDQRNMPLSEALVLLFEQDRVAIVSCIPGKLAYYKAERHGYILEVR